MPDGGWVWSSLAVYQRGCVELTYKRIIPHCVYLFEHLIDSLQAFGTVGVYCSSV